MAKMQYSQMNKRTTAGYNQINYNAVLYYKVQRARLTVVFTGCHNSETNFPVLDLCTVYSGGHLTVGAKFDVDHNLDNFICTRRLSRRLGNCLCRNTRVNDMKDRIFCQHTLWFRICAMLHHVPQYLRLDQVRTRWNHPPRKYSTTDP